MSWLSETLHGHFDNPLPWILGGGALLAAAPFALPALGGALGIGEGAAAAGAAGVGAEGAGAAGFGGTAGLEGLGGSAATGFGAGGSDALGAFALGGDISPFAGVGDALSSGAFDAAGANGLTPGGTIFDAFPAGEGISAPAAPGAASVSAPAGVTPALGVDPTAIAGPSAASPFDTAAWPTGPGGAPGGTGVAQVTGDVGGITSGAGANPVNVGSATSFGPGSANASPWSIDSLVSGAGKSIAANPIGLGLSTAGLGYAIAQGQSHPQGYDQMKEIAGRLGPAGQQLMQYLQSGTLPPGLQQSVSQANQAARARIISNYGTQGMSTDPSRNSALAAELANVDRQSAISIAQIGERLMNEGVQASGLASNIYGQIANIDQTQTQNVGRAIANMAAALSPSRTTIQLGGAR